MTASPGHSLHHNARTHVSRLTRLVALPLSGAVAPTLVVALVLTIVSWPVTDIVPQAGLDPSWQSGLAMAFHQGLQWGPRMDFTYGPVGFLTVPSVYYGTTALLSLAFLLVSRLLVFALLLRAARAKLPGYWPVLAAYLIGATVVAAVDPADELMACLVLIGSLALWSQSERSMTWAAAALGALAGTGLLLKFSVGLLGLGTAVVVTAGAPRWGRDALVAAATFAGYLARHMDGDRQLTE